jgi:ABC-2 type transport system ATP-binding protein
MAYAITADGLRKSFGRHAALTGLDLRVEAGSVFALLGPNGAGKTTTVRILSTLIAPDAGLATVAGHDVTTEAEQVRAAISLTGQYAAVDLLLTGEENLLLMARLRHLRRGGARERVTELLEQFDLAAVARRKVSTYSGGMRRRLDLAMSLLSKPVVLFLDEPTTGLDPRSRRGVWDAVGELTASGVTTLLTTQNLEEADRLADHIAVVDRGQVIANGSADELKDQVGSETVELFFSDEQALADALRAIECRDGTGGALRSGGDVNRDLLSVSLAGDGTAAGVKQWLDVMAQADIEVSRLALHRPSLDEVFLALTAQPAADSPAEHLLERT